MTERILRARFEGDSSGLKRMAQEGKQAIDSIVDAQERASREWTDIVREAETEATSVVKQGTDRRASEVEKSEKRVVDTIQREAKRRIAVIQRETDEAIKAIEKLPLAREEKERQIARVVETNAKRTSDILLQEIRKQEQAHQQVSAGLGSHSEAAIALTRSIAGLVAAYVSLQSVIGLAKQGLAGNADLQQAGLTFEVLFKDADRAKVKIEELYDFAAKTPFEFGPVKDAALALETFGLNSSEYLRDAGDLAAAFNAEISEVARVFGRINSGDFGEAFERLRDFGISRELLEGEGLVFDKSGSYQGSVDQALTAVQNIIREKFGGMMERQAQIANGQMSTLADNFQMILNSTMAPAFDTLSEAVAGLNTSLDGAFGDEMQENVRVLGDIVNGVAVGALALGRAIGNTLDEMMAPLRWLRDTATALGAAAGQRDVARALVMSSDINPNRREHYANLVGQGESVQGIARDFRVRSWGDSQGVQEDLGKIAVAISKARMIVEGSIQYQNFEPFGPPVPPGGVTTRTSTKTSASTVKPLEGHQLFTAQHKAGDLSDEQYLARLNVELGKVVKNSSDYFAIREKIAGLKPDPWLEKIFEQSPGALDLRLGQHIQGNFGASLPITTLADRIGGAFETPTAMLGLGDPGAPAKAELFGPGYGKDYDEFLKREAAKLQKLAEDADKALQSGLEAGLSAFLDGGIGNLGEATYSLSKDAFSKALVEGVMSSEVKDAVGALGESLGAALQHPVTAAIAVAAMGLNEIKRAFDEIDRHNQGLAELKRKYTDTPFAETTSASDLRQMAKERAVYAQEAERDVGLFGALMGFGHTKSASQKKLGIYDSMIPALASQAFDESWQGRDKAIDSSSLAEALAATEAAAWSFATANGLSVEVSNQLIEAKRGEVKAAWEATQAAKDFADSMGAYGGLMKSFDWQERLGGGPMDSTDLRYAGIAATGGRLDIGNIDQNEAIRLAELYGLMQYGGEQGAAQYGVGMVKPKTTREQIVEIIGYDPGKDEGGDRLLPLLDQMVLPMLAKMQELTGGGQTQAIGSMSNPDHALQFDAPQTRNIVNNNQFTVQSQAFMGDRSDAREFARMIWAELRELEGQSV